MAPPICSHGFFVDPSGLRPKVMQFSKYRLSVTIQFQQTSSANSHNAAVPAAYIQLMSRSLFKIDPATPKIILCITNALQLLHVSRRRPAVGPSED